MFIYIYIHTLIIARNISRLRFTYSGILKLAGYGYYQDCLIWLSLRKALLKALNMDPFQSLGTIQNPLLWCEILISEPFKQGGCSVLNNERSMTWRGVGCFAVPMKHFDLNLNL